MQRIAVGRDYALEFFAGDSPDGPRLPSWLPVGPRYLPARLGHPRRRTGPIDLVAVWPERAPDPGRAAPWTVDDLAGLLLAQARETFHCRVCGGRVNALYPDGGLPSWGGDHRMATHCPLCEAHVDQARLHALALFAP